MTKSEHLQFLALMIPTLLILAAAAVSMADLTAEPAAPVPQSMAVEDFVPAAPAWDEAYSESPGAEQTARR